MGEGPLSDEQIAGIKKAVEKLKSKKPVEREAAQKELDALGASKFDVLIALLQKEAAGRRKRRRCVFLGIGAYVLLVVIMLVVPLLFHHRPEMHILTNMGGLTGVIVSAMAASAAQKNATQALGEFDDKRGVGWWALALEYDDKETAALARKKLVQLLPQLTYSDRHLMDDEQRKCLYRALHKIPVATAEGLELHKAILKAIEQVGDETALPYVEKLANGEGPAERFPDLKIAAIECLPALRERIELSHASQTLLRASTPEPAGGNSSDVLLRPVAHSSDVRQDELLRASDVETEAEVPPAPAWTTAQNSDGPVHVVQGR